MPNNTGTKEIDYGANGGMELDGWTYIATGTVEYMETIDHGDRQTAPSTEVEIESMDVVISVQFSDGGTKEITHRKVIYGELVEMVRTRALEELQRGEY